MRISRRTRPQLEVLESMTLLSALSPALGHSGGPVLAAATTQGTMTPVSLNGTLTQSWSLTSSTCNLKISASYSFLPIFGWPLTPECLVSLSSVDFDFLPFLDFLLIVLSGFLGIGRLFRGWPVFLRAEVRPFCRPFVVQRQGWQQAQSETLVRGLTLRRLIITRGNLSTNTKKILSACYWRA